MPDFPYARYAEMLGLGGIRVDQAEDVGAAQVGRCSRHAACRPCYTVPTDAPEADGTFDWDSMTLALVEVTAGDRTGLGYTYADAAAGQAIRGALAKEVEGGDALDIPALHAVMLRRVRNLGRAGICATAIAAVDNALWDRRHGSSASPCST